MYLYIRGRGSGCALGLQLPCSRGSSINDGSGGCERWKIFGKIILRDGSVPQIELESTNKKNGRKMEDVIEAPITGLESAVWFKVLILDTICLNLETKCIQWTSCDIRGCTERRLNHQPFSSCKHSHELYLEQHKDNMTAGRDLEKGLEIARSILNGSNDNEHQDVLLLLHVYVLPIIRLHASDRKHVSSALDTQIQILSQLDDAIDKMTNERHDIKKTMKDWRQDICDQLTDDQAIASCNIHFLELLHQHLQNDLRNAYVELDGCQEKVDQCKGSLTKKRGSQYISDLVDARKARDRVADYINKSLFVMEEVHLILSVTTLPERNELTDQHRAYIQIQEECKRHSKELHDLQRKKLLATSVREALVSTKSELNEGRETTGIDITSDGLARSTDVLGPTKLPAAWQTLPSRVSEALEKNKTLNELHHDFSSQIVTQCREEIKGQPSIKRLRPKLDVGSSWKKLAKKQSNSSNQNHEGERVRRSTRNSLKEKRPTAHYQAVTQAMKGDVNQHFQEVCRLLASHLGLPLAYSRSDLWSCYERAFFPGKIPEMLKLYVYAYEAESKLLQRVLPSSNLQDMQLDDEWILNILGLYAPTFDIHGEVEVAEEVRESLLLSKPVLGIHEEQDVMEGREASEEEENVVSSISTVLKQRLNVDDDIRSRLESGVEIDISHEMHGHVASVKKTSPRKSWRNTQIVDFRWVTVPIDIEERHLMALSEPCIVKKQELLKNAVTKEYNNLSRHSSYPEIKLRKSTGRDQYLQQAKSLTSDVERTLPLVKKDVHHLDDHIGDDSGVFNDHAEEEKQMQTGDCNCNMLERTQKPAIPDVHSASSLSEASRDTQESLDDDDKIREKSSIPDVASSGDSLAEGEKMSIHSIEPVSDAHISVMIQGVDGEIRLDQALSRRCQQKPAISEFLKRFSQAYHYFRVVLEESVPTSKLQWLLRCLKEVNSVAEKQAALISCGKQRMLSGDDLLTALILFLIHGDPGEVTAFYPQLKFLEDYLPDFLDKGEVGFAVIQFESAYSYILRVKPAADL